MCTTWLLITVCLILSTVAEDATQNQKENGILATCPLSVLDITISSTTTDAIKLKLAIGGPGDFHSYNISKGASLISDPLFRKDFRTVLYVPGFLDSPVKISGPKIIEAYRVRGRHNIILVDTNGLTDLEYFRSSRVSKYIGIRLGKVLSQFRKSGMNMDTFDLVGHSLGAHMSGFAGKSYFKTTGVKLPRIVGLDPAGPCFKGADEENRLSKGDAEFVQVIHTNGGANGMKVPIGDLDFYVNGGSKQPGYRIYCGPGCSHYRAVDLWSFSVMYPNKFIGIRCADMKEVDEATCFRRGRKLAIMGPTASPRAKGMFYVWTANREPYFNQLEEEVHYRKQWC